MRKLLALICLLPSLAFAQSAPLYTTPVVVTNIASAPDIAGKVIYVAPWGNDVTADGSYYKPYKSVHDPIEVDASAPTWRGANKIAQAGDTIVLTSDTHYFGVIPLKDNVNLIISPGATVFRAAYFSNTVFSGTPFPVVADLNTVGPLIQPGSNSTVTAWGATIITTNNADSNFDAGYGWNEGLDTWGAFNFLSFTNRSTINSVLYGGRFIGSTDVFYLVQTAVAKRTATIVASHARDGWDGIRAAGNLDLATYQLLINSTNTSSSGGDMSRGVVNTGGVTWTDTGSHIITGGGDVDNQGVLLDGATTTAILNLSAIHYYGSGDGVVLDNGATLTGVYSVNEVLVGGGGGGTNTWYEDGDDSNAVRLGNTTGNSELIRVFTGGVGDTPRFSVDDSGNIVTLGNLNVAGALTMTAWNTDDLAMGFYNDGALDRVTGLTAGQSIRVDSGGTGFEAYTPVSASSSPTLTGVTITGGTVTASDPVLEMTQTWNSGGVTFTGVDMNITDTASATASRLMDIRVGGNPMVRIKKIGTIEGRGGMVLHGNPTGFAGTAPSDGQLVLSDGSGNAIIRVAQNSGGQINLASGGVLSFTGSSTDSTTTKDTIVSRPSAGVVSIDTTAAGNSAGLVKANGYFEGLFSTATGFTLTATNSIVKVTTSATVTFPTAVGITGRSYTLKAMTGVTITLATTSSQTIDGAAPGTITALQARRITSDGANWIITAGF